MMMCEEREGSRRVRVSGDMRRESENYEGRWKSFNIYFVWVMGF